MFHIQALIAKLEMSLQNFFNRKEGNDQKSIQLPNTFRPSHQGKRKTHLKQRLHNQNTTSRKPNRQFFPKIGQTAIQNKKVHQDMQSHTMTKIVNSSTSTVLTFIGMVSKNLTEGGGRGGGRLNRLLG